MMTEEQRQAFSNRLDKALDEAHAALRPLFDHGPDDGGVYQLPEAEGRLLHELMFKIGAARYVIAHRDYPPAWSDEEWKRSEARKAALLEASLSAPR
jgi:hypothetical protein